MAEYRISGIWKDENDIITHYAFHTINENSAGKSVKVSKSQAITLLDNSRNSALTMMWNYLRGEWTIGEKVSVVNGVNGKYLRSNPDNKITDNLGHLIDFDWIAP